MILKENKKLLLKDLCSRLPYEIKGKTAAGEVVSLMRRGQADYDIITSITNAIEKHGWRPYLFPLSSMTEEQKEELDKLCWYFDNYEIHNINEYHDDKEIVTHIRCSELVDWLNKNKFDYRGLIPMGLADDATGLNIY